MLQERRPLLFSVLYAIYALDIMGIVIVFVLFPSLLLNADIYLPNGTPLATRSLVLGLLLAAYPITQFFGAPLLGELSDRIGQRRVLMVAVLLTAAAFSLTAIAAAIGSLGLLFLSRLLGGLFAGNLTITQASAANRLEKDQQPHYMALFAAFGGVGGVIGPYVGEVLSDSKIVGWFNPSVPFWAMSIAFIITALLLPLWMAPSNKKLQASEFQLGRAFLNMGKAFKPSPILHPLIASIVTMIGWMMFIGFLGAYVMERYHFAQEIEAYVYVDSSVGWLAGGLAANLWILRKFRPRPTNAWMLAIASMSVLSFLVIHTPGPVWAPVAIASFAQAVATGCFFSLFAQMGETETQGRIFGVWNAGFALANAIGPAVAGWLFGFWSNLSTLVAGCILSGATIYYVWWAARQPAER